LISVVVELCGIRSLSFAVGVYLPLSTTAPIFIGGMMKALVDRLQGAKEESELSPGMLYSTGLVAGGSLTGVLIAILSGIAIASATAPNGKVSLIQYIQDAVHVHGWENLGALADLIGIVMFGVLCFLLLRVARQKMEA
jgi:hypothetical protein